ncbi:uncharacterized protein LOC128740926 [Sabethes cyaneus]|uniref:uncharacterized protein LOC128740926 n=1 Tax=Sabethes cyaneus TaxID=53552 RepID=UPI00237E519B|nr:uncharacterized protein LOC128740926 [Sabethes cyaneus]
MSSYINDFNNNIQSYFISSTYGNETLVTNSLNHLALVTDERVFDVSVYGNNAFFVNLHKLMTTGTKKMSLLWSALSVLEAAARCEETRKALVVKFHFLPALTKMLEEIHNGEQQQRLLALIEQLTHGLQLESHEPYVETLLLKLLALMEQNHGHKDKTELVTLALSILVNLCYMNLPMTYLLTKNISISSFCGKIKQFGLVACKMYIILEKNDYLKEMDLHYLLKMSFKEVRNVLASGNSFVLRHVVDYLQYILKHNSRNDGSKENNRNAVNIEDEFFRKNLKEFLEDVDKHASDKTNETGNVSTRKKRKASNEDKKASMESTKDDCMDVLFEILECIVALEPIGEIYLNSMVDLAAKWIQSKQSCAKAVDLLRVILDMTSKGNQADQCTEKFVNSCQKLLIDLLSIVKNNDDKRLLISLCKLLTTIVKVQNALHSELQHMVEPLFQHFFGHVMESKHSFDYSLPDSDILVYLWALHTFNEFANVAPTLWFAKVNNLLNQKPLHFLIAKGLTSGCLELTEAMLHVSASVDFPRREVSQMVSMLATSWRGAHQSTPGTMSAAAPTPWANSTAISRDLLDRMNRTASHIQDVSAAGHINDVTKVELIEFYQLKFNMETQLMDDLRVSLAGMSSQISNLMHQNQLLAAEIEKVQRKNLPLVLKVSAQEAENQSLEKELNHMRCATASYDKKINQMKQELSDYIKKASEKTQQCAALAKEVEAGRVRNENYEKENKRLQHDLAEMTKNRDDSRKLLKIAEEERQKLTEQKTVDRKMFETKIREREREISKHTVLISQLEQQLSDRDAKLEKHEEEAKDLLAQIATKDERIEQIEAELKESESIQKAIYSLMNKKK